MPIISQSRLNNLMNVLNSGIEEVNHTVTEETNAFGTELAEIWESKSAQEFAQKVEDAIKDSCNQYSRVINTIYRNLGNNVNNHNLFNNESVTLMSLTTAVPNVRIREHIQEHFTNLDDGDSSGLRKGADPTIPAQRIVRLGQAVMESMSKTTTGITNSGAFDDDEVAAVAGALRNVQTNFSNTIQQLAQEVNKSLGVLSSEAAKLQSTNTSNVSVD